MRILFKVRQGRLHLWIWWLRRLTPVQLQNCRWLHHFAERWNSCFVSFASCCQNFITESSFECALLFFYLIFAFIRSQFVPGNYAPFYLTGLTCAAVARTCHLHSLLNLFQDRRRAKQVKKTIIQAQKLPNKHKQPVLPEHGYAETLESKRANLGRLASNKPTNIEPSKSFLLILKDQRATDTCKCSQFWGYLTRPTCNHKLSCPNCQWR